jgi:bifunctional non-homologous end joining protein LigD
VAKKLREYERKRDFAATPEPSGEEPPGATDLPRFVIQEHSATRLHWDLRLEHDGALMSWAIPNGVPMDPKENRKAIRTEDHPLEYLEFHGEIPKGQYGAGTMTIWDRGTYVPEKIRDREVIVVFNGERVQGRYALFQTGSDPKDWMIHRMDPPADPAREPMPERIVPMLAKPGPLPADEERYGFEIKWDGMRAIVYSQPGRIRFQGRNLNDITAQWPELRRMNRALHEHDAVVDGEIVAFDADGKPSFARLQRRMHLTGESQIQRAAKSVPATYVAFDLLYLDGHSLMQLPYEERRERLEALDLNGPSWRTPPTYLGEGRTLLEASKQQGLEGVVAKRRDSPYLPGQRSSCWIKVKNKQRAELVIGGYLPGERKVGAVLLGRREDGRLRYAGRAGSGLKESDVDGLLERTTPRESSPFEGEPTPPRGSKFVEPELTADVEFTDWTDDGVLRHPTYKGIVEPITVRPLKKPNAFEATVEGRVLRLTNLDKVLYPQAGFTKGDMIDYYTRVAPALLPHLRGRPLTLKRYPNGVEGDYFYEKQCPSHRPDWVRTASISTGRKKIDFCLCEDLPTLVWLANLADIELHTSLSLADRIERPTMMVFDLDPGEPANIVQCCRVSAWLREIFDPLALESFAKTSGSKGLQVYVPLNTDVTYDDTKPFAKAVAELLEKQHPELVVSRMSKELRPGKVLVDWSQNDEHKTTVNVYSLRAKDRPTVSTPVSWDEVERCLEADDPSLLVFEHDEVLRRVEREGDLFAPVLALVQELPRF